MEKLLYENGVSGYKYVLERIERDLHKVSRTVEELTSGQHSRDLSRSTTDAGVVVQLADIKKQVSTLESMVVGAMSIFGAWLVRYLS